MHLTVCSAVILLLYFYNISSNTSAIRAFVNYIMVSKANVLHICCWISCWAQQKKHMVPRLQSFMVSTKHMVNIAYTYSYNISKHYNINWGLSQVFPAVRLHNVIKSLSQYVLTYFYIIQIQTYKRVLLLNIARRRIYQVASHFKLGLRTWIGFSGIPRESLCGRLRVCCSLPSGCWRLVSGSALQVKTNARPTMQQQYIWLMLNGKSKCRAYCAAKVMAPKNGSGRVAGVGVLDRVGRKSGRGPG